MFHHLLAPKVRHHTLEENVIEKVINLQYNFSEATRVGHIPVIVKGQ